MWSFQYKPDGKSVGIIRVDEQRNPQYPHVVENIVYTLEGGPYYYINGHYVPSEEKIDTKKGILTLGEMRFRIIDFRANRNLYLVRVDGWRAVAICRLRRWTVTLNLIYRRLILTATIWNLATYQDGNIPSWRDLKCFQRGGDDG